MATATAIKSSAKNTSDLSEGKLNTKVFNECEKLSEENFFGKYLSSKSTLFERINKKVTFVIQIGISILPQCVCLLFQNFLKKGRKAKAI